MRNLSRYVLFKGIVRKIFIGSSESPNYDIIWNENGDMIDSFIPDILTLEKCSKRVQYVSNTCRTRFEYSLNVNIFGRTY